MHDTVPLIVRRARHNIGVRKIYCRKYRIYIYGAFLEAALLARWGPSIYVTCYFHKCGSSKKGCEGSLISLFQNIIYKRNCSKKKNK